MHILYTFVQLNIPSITNIRSLAKSNYVKMSKFNWNVLFNLSIFVGDRN